MEQKYKLRAEVRQYFTLSQKNLEQSNAHWVNDGVSFEALEEVPQSIELDYGDEVDSRIGTSNFVMRKDRKQISHGLKDRMEKAVNGECLDIDEISDFICKHIETPLNIDEIEDALEYYIR